MILKNKTRNKIITKNLKIAHSYLDNLFGLLREPNNTSMLFQTRFGLHTFFMKYPIDILVLDSKNKIVKIKKNLPPNHLYFWIPKYSKVIELPHNNYQIKVADELDFEFEPKS